MARGVNDGDLVEREAELWALPWRCALRAPLRIGAHTQEHRAGVLIAARVGEVVGLGDACPLPGLSTDHLADVVAALDAISADTCVLRQQPSPATHWAIDSSYRELSNRLKGPVLTTRVQSALLITSLDDPRLSVAQGGAGVVKLKVGRGELAAERAAIEALRRAGCRKIRLDANRGLDVDDALALADAAGDDLEFFEEPTATGSLSRLAAVLPVALDESIDELLLSTTMGPAFAAGAAGAAALATALRGLPPAAAWVLKPTVLGAATQTALDVAAELGVAVIISSAYESRVGRRALALCAAQVSDGAHGLGTGVAFAEDVCDGVSGDAFHGALHGALLEEGPGWLEVKASPPWSTLAQAGPWRRLR